jgi:hypothetical protein
VLAWARARTDRVFIRFDYVETTWWAGAGPPPGDPPLPALPERPTVFVERATVRGRMVDWALAAQAGVHPELLVSGREAPGRVTLTVEVDDLEARLRWLRDLGATVLQETAGVALVEDPEGNRALLVRRRPDEPARRPRS